MNIQTPTPDLRMVPLADLVLSDLNARQNVDQGEIEAMAESIAIAGLLQNLIGIEAEDGKIAIVGGGKRLRALQLLSAEGGARYADVAPIRFDAIPVKVTDDIHRAISWAGTENTARSALHPADEVRAYSAMRERGSSSSMIARSFAVTEAHVERRLKLASLPAEVLDALRGNEITLDMAKALTLAKDKSKCLMALSSVRGRGGNPEAIRRELTAGGIRSTDRRAVFVGMVRYTAEGGKSNRDLFEGHSYLLDEKLLDRLFREKLTAAAAELGAEQGWKWVETIEDSYFSPWEMKQRLTQIYREPVDLPEADMEEYDRLSELAESGAIDEDGAAQLETLEDRMAGEFSDEDRATGGVYVYVDREGKLACSAPYRRAEDEPAAEETGDSDTGRNGKAPTPEPKGFPQNLTDDLRAIRLAALQTAMLDQHELLLDLLAFTLSGETSPYYNPLSISITAGQISPEKPEGTTLDARLTPESTLARADASPETFASFRAKGKKHRNTVLTHALARSLRQSANVSRGLHELMNDLATYLALDVRRIWTPTAAGFLGRVSSEYLDDLWAKLLDLPADDPQRGAFGKLKKAEKAKQLEALFSDMSVREAISLSREQNARIDAWLPGELRFDAPEAGGVSFTRAEKRKEALREVKMRRRVFARAVADGRMKQADADRNIDLMQAIADDYAPDDLFTEGKAKA